MESLDGILLHVFVRQLVKLRHKDGLFVLRIKYSIATYTDV